VRYTLKHRLIGAAVLAAVAVLLLPSFFKEKKEYQVNTKSQIPARPNVVAEEFKAPQPVPNIEPAPAPETMFVPTEAVPDQPVAAVSSASASSVAAVVKTSVGSVKAQVSSVPAMPLNTQGLPDAWVVQVGSFTTKEAANKLRDDLQADGQKAYVRTTTSGSGSISRVYIGPKLDKNQALALKDQMDKRLKVKSMVMRFQP
jgi:DedD protein